MSIIFLDMDGVLNKHIFHENGYCGTEKDCVENFNFLLKNTTAQIVISSAWRYLITRGSMTLMGFENLLLSHGVDCRDRVIGHTRESYADGEPRSQVIKDYISENKVTTYVILDDLDLNMNHHIKTESHVGLTKEQAELAIKILNDT